ncbi:hypothetical protein TH66_20960 [Carbonactinospora thermoautotrophica]|uniref:Serine/threonine protein phosphatase PstP n=1 Tax=Carbonactinospora thermoautotrophica TaxID=1469144 RepID=A0A132MJ77_9ACTN|nr:PP2C family serine/threonine-protein phosphatase [Carbonactinospora thermoautotrophica]KWW97878.1 hypothetical protein TH66_20960 [Carbonactinospora thermoautotrophica]KWX08743.1 hypothetical protein TR74_13615 [Carbonactinospora thermoautotrophica]
MTLSLRFAARSDVGLLRDGNEDSGYAGPRLLAVADGMGGQAAGEVASSVVIANLAPLDDEIPGTNLLDLLAVAVERANEQLRHLVEQHPQLEGMGTTLTALLWSGARIGMVHVGDSRAYLLRDGRLTQITHDHTWVQQLVDEGRITEEEADHHPQRSLLMRAIDGRGNVDLDLSIREARPGDRYLLCSDGLSGVVSRETIEATLPKGDPEEAVDALVQLALRGGGPDNITCIVADVVEDPQPPMIPQVVGAAAEHQARQQAQPSMDTAAGRAAVALQSFQQPPPDESPTGYGEPPEFPRRRSRAVKWVLGLGLVLALATGGLYGAYRWTQNQYYVGAEKDKVAIYRGLNQELAGFSMSSLYQASDVSLNELPPSDREQLARTLPAKNLDHAKQIVNELRLRAADCQRAREQAQRKQKQQPGTTPDPKPSAAQTGLPSVESQELGLDATGTPPPSGQAADTPDQKRILMECGNDRG